MNKSNYFIKYVPVFKNLKDNKIKGILPRIQQESLIEQKMTAVEEKKRQLKAISDAKAAKKQKGRDVFSKKRTTMVREAEENGEYVAQTLTPDVFNSVFKNAFGRA